jgi:hypothetical protein
MRAVALLLIMLIMFGAASAKQTAPKADSKDYATADGSVRAGLHNGKVYAVSTGTNTAVVLTPDSWTGEDESKNWNLWLVDFDNSLYSNWVDSNSGDGQETVLVRIGEHGVIIQDPGNYYGPAQSPDDKQAFASAITRTLDKTLKSASPMPHTVNPLKEIRYALTFMRGSKSVPLYGKEQLGFVAALNSAGDNVDVFGRMKEGRAPGIQIVSDRDGGKIQVTDDGPFLQKCREIGSEL